MVKNLPAVLETWVRSLGWEDPLEKEWLPTPVFLPGESHRQRSLVGYSAWGLEESDTTEAANASTWSQDLCQLLGIRKDEKGLFSLCTQKILFLMGK